MGKRSSHVYSHERDDQRETILDNHGDNVVTMYTHMREEIRES
jgi:hypothetical protein